MAKFDANMTGAQQAEKYVVRNVHITVEVKVAKPYHIQKGNNETVEDMFIRMRDAAKNPEAKRECDICRAIVKWAETCNGEVSNVLPRYSGRRKRDILDICIDFANHEDSGAFCKDLNVCVNGAVS